MPIFLCPESGDHRPVNTDFYMLAFASKDPAHRAKIDEIARRITGGNRSAALRFIIEQADPEALATEARQARPQLQPTA